MNPIQKKMGIFVFLTGLGFIVSGASCDGNGSPSVMAVNQLISELCAAVDRCDDTLTESGCVTEMNDEANPHIWDNFGLGQGDTWDTDEVKTGIKEKDITVDETALENCLDELRETCDAEGELHDVESYDNAEDLISEDGSCPSVLKASE